MLPKGFRSRWIFCVLFFGGGVAPGFVRLLTASAGIVAVAAVTGAFFTFLMILVS